MISEDVRTFELVACLGRGGFGEVYRARMHRGNFAVDVAVKLLRADIDPRGHAAGRLRDEARLMGRVRHRALPRVYDLVELEGRLALVSELLDGADLDNCLRMSPPPPLRAVLEALAEVAAALHAAATTLQPDGQPLGLVHRDLKPANLRLLPDGGVKVLDLGIAWAAGLDRHAETQTGALIGSPAYMSPERFLGDPPAGPADIYALGCVLAEVLLGRRLWSDAGYPVLAALAVDEHRYRMALHARLALPPALDPELVDSLEAALAWDPASRPTAQALSQTWADIAHRLPKPGLAAWAASAPWSSIAAPHGSLTGQTLREGIPRSPGAAAPSPAPAAPSHLRPVATPLRVEAATAELERLDSALVTPADPLEPTPPRRAEAGRSDGGTSLTGLLPTLGFALAAALVIGVGWSVQTDLNRPPDTADAPLEAPAVVSPAPAPPAVAAAADGPTAPAVAAEAQPPAPPPEPVPARKAPTPAPARPPSTSAPEPAAAPDPVVSPEPIAPRPPTAPTRVRVSVDADTQVMRPRLVGDAGAFDLPGEVPPGTYRILAEKTRDHPQVLGNVVVREGQPVAIRCVHGLCGAR